VVEHEDAVQEPTERHAQSDHSHDILTVANIITVLRLILVPMFFAVLLSGRSDGVAFVLFAVAASTDWLDGQIARRTGTVTALGAAIDPLVDRLLIASGVVGVYLLGRLPLWVVVVLVARDVYLLAGAAYLARRGARSVEVVFVGKLTTALLLFGFSDLILNWPRIPGLGMIDSPSMPGLGSTPAAAGLWFVYMGIATSLVTAVVYTIRAAKTVRTLTPRR